jgi:uncharacterized repeat protein (TIGR03803 family)
MFHFVLWCSRRTDSAGQWLNGRSVGRRRYFAPLTAIMLALASLAAAQPAYEAVHLFPPPGAVRPYAPLVLGTDGNFYGTTVQGGTDDLGTVFRVTPAGVLTKLHDFKGNGTPTDGAYPYAPMILASDGNLYGTTLEGGTFGTGVIYRLTHAGSLTIVHSIQGSVAGYPYAPVYEHGGFLYGTTYYGANLGCCGSVFRFNLSTNAFQTLRVFSGAPDAANPFSPLRVASDGNLYGLTIFGGTSNNGAIIKVVPGTGEVSVAQSFAGTVNGYYPGWGGLTEVGGVLYGTTENGGVNAGGTIFSYPLSGGAIVVRHSFNYHTGYSPIGGLTLVGGLLYGTTPYMTGGPGSGCGAAACGGSVFQFNPSTNAVVNLHNFSVTDGNQSHATVILGPDGALYGTTVLGGSAGAGVIFKKVIGGAFSLLHTFSGGAEGHSSRGEIIPGPDGNVYGTTEGGGNANRGTVFKMTPAGVVTTLHHFKDLGDGLVPGAGLLLASDGLFYGPSAAISGGAYYFNVQIFKVSAAGGDLSVVRVFNANTEGYGINRLIQLGDGLLYGTAENGGASGHGTIFKMTTAGVVSMLHTFAGGAGGSAPDGALVLATDGMLYGTTRSGGNFNGGTIFRINTTGTGYQVVHHLNPATEGSDPKGGVIQATDGFFYGTTSAGTATTFGSVYKMGPSPGFAFTVLHVFQANVTDGAYPFGELVQVPSLGVFLGTTSSGGTTVSGTVYQINSTGTTYSVLHNFAPPTGVGPYVGLTKVGNTTYYGTTYLTSNVTFEAGGSVFRMRVPAVAFTDDPLVAGTTVIKAVHITELRSRIDVVRAAFGLGGYPYTGDVSVGTTIQAVHINDLRTALAQAYTAAGRTPPTYTTDPTLTIGTVIKAAHINELRTALAAIE